MPKFIEPLIETFEKLPGVGKKTATRYAYWVIEKLSNEEVSQMAIDLVETKNKIKNCKVCNIITSDDVCEICSDEKRNHDKILVVKDSKDAFAIERTNQYDGIYHITSGLISPLDGIGPDDINLDSLEERIKQKECKELIIALGFTPNGETTTLYIERVLEKYDVKITKIGYGLPAGGDIEYADELTLRKALETRK